MGGSWEPAGRRAVEHVGGVIPGRPGRLALACLLLLAALPLCHPFQVPAPAVLGRRAGARGSGTVRPGRRAGILPLRMAQLGGGDERLRVVGEAEEGGFDTVTGYGDMTGVPKFDDAWVQAYRKKDRIRCPFWRRRTVDALEVVLHMARFVLARHKSLNVIPPGPTGAKAVGLSLSEVAAVIQRDFEVGQYYVSGRLSKKIYADDCYFDAPDPDMPVRGLRKYVDAISHLFEHKTSRVDLLNLYELPAKNALVATWRLEGTLMLPWRPKVRAYTGVTLYELDDQGLVYRHTELWSVPMFFAFLSAVLPLDSAWGRRLGVPPPAPPIEVLRTLPLAEQAPDPTPLLTSDRKLSGRWSTASKLRGPRVSPP